MCADVQRMIRNPFGSINSINITLWQDKLRFPIINNNETQTICRCRQAICISTNYEFVARSAAIYIRSPLYRLVVYLHCIFIINLNREFQLPADPPNSCKMLGCLQIRCTILRLSTLIPFSFCFRFQFAGTHSRSLRQVDSDR